MIRNSKALGLALFAVLALGAVTAAGAQAAEEFFHTDVGTKNPDSVIVTGEALGPGSFSPVPGGASISCKTAKFQGTEEVAAGTLETHTGSPSGTTLTGKAFTLAPVYTECVAFGGIAATVQTSGCHFKLTSETDVNGHGQVHLECETGKKIIISAGGCEIKTGSQTPKQGVNYTNNNPGSTSQKTITAKVTMSGIAYETNGSAACTLVGIPKNGTEGVTTNEVTVKAFEDLEKTATGTYVEGSQLGVWKGPAD